MGEAVKGNVLYPNIVLIAEVASTIISRIAVDAFIITVLAGHTDTIPVSGRRRKVEDTDQMSLFRKANIGDDT